VGKFNNKAKLVDFDADIAAISGDIWLRRGLTDKVDAGLKLSIPGSITTDLRLGLLNEDKGDRFSVATGLGFIYTNGSSETGNRKDKTKIWDVLIPLYLSKDLGKTTTVYFVPRYVQRSTKNTRETAGQTTEEKFSDPMIGLGGGMMFNLGNKRDKHIAFEYNRVFDPNEANHYNSQGGVGLSFEF